MNQVLDFFRKLFDTSDWPPRWHCGNWTQFHGWLYIISDLLIWSAYFAIPLIILKYLSRRAPRKFVKTYFLFAAFILACGSTHFLDAVTFWFPAYRLNALIRLITGVVSWMTVFHLFRIMPEAMRLKSAEELEKEIEERKNAESQLRFVNKQLNEAQQIARLGYWQWDIKDNKVEWSSQMRRIYGVDHDSPLGYQEFIDVVHPDDRDKVNKAIETAFQTRQFPDYVHRILLKDGTERILQARGEVVTDAEGEIIRMMGTGQDVTREQKAQQLLIEKTEQLERTNEELKRFAYVASHDLQEPLRKILTFSSLLANEELNDKSRTYVDKMVYASQRMQQLIDDILHFSSLRTDPQNFRPTDLNTALQNALSDLEVKIQSSSAVIDIQNKLPTIDAIPSQIEQLFQNLISNAIKFRKEGEDPKIQITGSLVAGSQLEALEMMVKEPDPFLVNKTFVQITVSDNGIGFDPAYANKIFEVFQRLHNRNVFEGTGIGLAICKRIVENHNGFVKAASQPGLGSVFTIILPVKRG